jgi:hypothetical protein
MPNPLRNLKQQLQFVVIWPRQLFPALLFLLFIKDQADDQQSRFFNSSLSFLQHNIFKRKIKTNYQRESSGDEAAFLNWLKWLVATSRLVSALGGYSSGWNRDTCRG